jgi:hypothetical protein
MHADSRSSLTLMIVDINRQWSGSAMVSPVVVAALVVTSMATGNTTRPNLLFMMSDQQRHDTLGIVTPSLATPNLDRELEKLCLQMHDPGRILTVTHQARPCTRTTVHSAPVPCTFMRLCQPRSHPTWIVSLTVTLHTGLTHMNAVHGMVQ